MDPEIFPMRINKYLAHKQYATRRGADELIERGKVFINGRKAVLGDKVEESDVVEVREKNQKQKYLYYAFHKPKDSLAHPKLPPGVRALVTLGDHDAGLMLYTNDGRITSVITDPATSPEKEYVARTQTPLRNNFQEIMERGVEFEGFVSSPCRVEIIDDTTFVIALREQKKNQVRRMCSALKVEVTELRRTRIENIVIGKLAQGATRQVKDTELSEFLHRFGF